MAAQWELVCAWLESLQQLGGALPSDVVEIAAGAGVPVPAGGAGGGGPAPGAGPAAKPGSGAGKYEIHIGQAQGLAIGDGAKVEMTTPTVSTPGGTGKGEDIYAHYTAGLETLLQKLGSGHPRYQEALTWQQRLTENIHQTRLYGDTETRRAERAEVVSHLNNLASETTGQSFNDLSG
jgi:hypothetical protein